MLPIKGIMIPKERLRKLMKNQQSREIQRGFTYTIKQQVQLDELITMIRNYEVMILIYNRVVILNTKI